MKEDEKEEALQGLGKNISSTPIIPSNGEESYLI